MKKIKIRLVSFLMFLSVILIFSSCKKDFNEFLGEQFLEPSNTSSDIFIDGEIAVPIINTSLTLKNFIPSTDSSLWAEIDENDLVHLRMYFKDVVIFNIYDIYGNPVPLPVMPDSASASTDTNKLKVYENALSGHLYFDNPKFTFIVKNEIPVVTFLKIDTLRLISPAYDTTYVRPHKKYYVDAPTQQGNQVVSEVLIDKNELQNFEDFFSPIPKFVSFFVTIGNDQEQNLPPGYPSITGNEKVALDVDIDLPLDAHLVDFTLGDTVNFLVDSMENYEQIKSITIKLILDNEFPVGGISQIAFVDTTNHGVIGDTIMYLFDDEGFEFEPSITNSNGVTTSSVTSQITVELSQEQLATLKKYHTSKIIYQSKLNSYESQYERDIKIFGRYKLGVKLGMKVNYAGSTGSVSE